MNMNTWVFTPGGHRTSPRPAQQCWAAMEVSKKCWSDVKQLNINIELDSNNYSAFPVFPAGDNPGDKVVILH